MGRTFTNRKEDNEQHLRVKPAGSAYTPEELADEDSKTRAFFKDPEDWQLDIISRRIKNLAKCIRTPWKRRGRITRSSW